MKYIKQMGIILAISFLGEALHALLPLPIPASIYGMVLLFLALWTRLVRLDDVKETGHFLVEIMAVLFVCPAVGLIGCWDVLQENLVPILAVIILSLLATFAVSGLVTQWIMKKGGRKDV